MNKKIYVFGLMILILFTLNGCGKDEKSVMDDGISDLSIDSVSESFVSNQDNESEKMPSEEPIIINTNENTDKEDIVVINTNEDVELSNTDIEASNDNDVNTIEEKDIVTQDEVFESIGTNIAIAFLNVGDGLSVYVADEKGNDLLFDTGSNEYNDYLFDFLSISDKDNEIDYLILSHDDEEHTGNAIDLLKFKTINNLIIPEDNSISFENILTAKSSNTNKIIAETGDNFDFGEWNFKIVSSEIDLMTDERIIILQINNGDNTTLLTSDASSKLLNSISSEVINTTIIQTPNEIDIVPSALFLYDVNPDYIVDSNGEIMNLKLSELTSKLNIKVLSTYINGLSIFFSDGNEISTLLETESKIIDNDVSKHSDSFTFKEEESTVLEDESNIKETKILKPISITHLDVDKETITIKNNTMEKINLDGWYIISEIDGQSFYFKSFKLNAGETMTLNSSENAYSLASYRGEMLENGHYFWGDKNVWDEGDKGILYDNNDNIIDSKK